MEKKTDPSPDRRHKEIAELKTAELAFLNHFISVLEVDSKNYEDLVEPDSVLRSCLRQSVVRPRCPLRTLAACRP